MKSIFSSKIFRVLFTWILPNLLLAQSPSYLLELRNDLQVSSKVYEFDIYLLRTGTTEFEYASGQYGILLNPLIKNSGTITASIVTGSSDPVLVATAQNPITASFYVYPGDYNVIRVLPRLIPDPGPGAIISNVSPGTRLCRVRITNTVDFGQNQPNLTWTTTSNYPTQISAFVSGSPLLITNHSNHTTSNLINPVLNSTPPPTAFNVTGTGSYCEGTGGIPVGLDDSESGVTYTLYKNSISTGSTVAGTGSAISFGNQLSGTYTVKGTNITGTTDMTGSAVITENPNATITLTSGNNTQTVCINSAITNIVYTIGGGGTGAGVTGLPSGINGNFNAGSFTISGTPTQSGTFNYTVTTTGTCTQASATGTITVRAQQTAIAGPDQDGSAMCGLTSTTLAGNTPTEGTGSWSIISGTGGSITTPSSPTSTFTGTAGTTYILRWTISNPPCTASTDDVTITFHRNPTTAIAGPDQDGASMCGLTSTTLAANTPTIGTGAWSIISGTGGTVTTPSSPTSTFTGTAGTTYILRWTISNPPCTASTDDVTITFHRNPTTAIAGPDQDGASMCGLTSTTLAANTPAIGTGAWSIISGTGGTVTTPSSPTSTFTGTAGTTYVLRWTISNPPCTASTDDVTITFHRNPTTAIAGPDQDGASMCGLTSTTLAANTPTIGTGAWSIISGTGGTVTTPSSPTSTFTGTAGTTYILRWTISNPPCTASTDDVTITFHRNPTTAIAGPDQDGASMCGLTSTTLAGNTPTVGTGAWSIISGTGGTVTTPSSPTSTFTGTAGTTYILRWTISNPPCTASTDDVTITFHRNPTTAIAGPDQDGASMCGLNSTTLAGNTPTVGTGAWSIISGTGGSVTTPSSPTSTFTGAAGTTYVLRWTISNPPCTASTDDVTITFHRNPTTAIAGPDQDGASMCGLTSTTLAGNTPAIGTGAWSIISGTGGTVTTPSSPTSTFTGTAGATYILRWTISNTPCTASTDDVTITFHRNPTTAIAGPDQDGASMCGLTSTTLAANTPTIGTGAWSIISGTGGTVTTPSSPTSTLTGTAGTTYVLRWTISNPPCTASTDDVTITFHRNPTTAIAGPDQDGASMCGLTSTTLAGNTPAIGTGAWSIISGTGGTVTTPSSPTSTFTGTAGTTYVLRWTISNTPCTASTDDVTITFHRNPTTAIAGPDQDGASMCGLTSTTLAGNSPSVGTGAWSIISGTGGTVTAPSSATSTFTGTAGTTYVLRWTISNPPCTASTDDVTITFHRNPTTAIAGPDQDGASMCGLTSTTLAANTPTIGTGAWSIISGTGGTVTTPSSPTSTFTGTAGTTYLLRWTISNPPCTASTDDVTITFHRNPTTAIAGPDQDGASMCGLTSTTLAANTPAIGTGAWSIISGTGGTVTTPSSPTSTFTGTAGITYILRWTISNPPCTASTDDVTITFHRNPTTANAGPDKDGASMCGLTSTTLAGNTPTVGTGSWSIISGTGGSITTPSSPISTFNGIAGNTYILRWTISNPPCTESTDDVTITFHRTPTPANAGADQTGSSMCGLTSTTLAGNSPSVGTGSWSIISGTGGTVTTPSSPNSTFTGTAGTTYILRWTISNPPCTASTDDVTITFQRPPTTADAGPDQAGASTCGLTTVTLAGNSPSVGTGSWSIISGTGGSVTSPSSPTSTFSGVAGNSYTLRWTISNPPCTSSTDDVTITFHRNPTTASAGPDQDGSSMCGLTSTVLAANTPSVGTGSWSIISGSGGNIANPTNSASTFTGLPGTSYILRWTISNSPCPVSTDDVTIIFRQNPSLANAGPDQTGTPMCGKTSTTLAANSPAIGTGSWSIISGTGGSVASPSSPASTFTGTAGTTYVLRWTISNPPCTPSTDDVTITFEAQPAATLTSSDPDNIFCVGTTVTFIAGGGTNYNFKVGGSTVQNGPSNTYITSTLTNGQKVQVTVTSTAGCVASSPEITNFVNPVPTMDIYSAPACAPDLLTYSLTVTLVSFYPGTVTSTAGIVTNPTGNRWNIAQVPSGTNIVLTAKDINGCESTLPVTAPDCSCPVIPAPVSGGNKSYCQGGTIPTLSVTVNAGETADWYNVSSGGTPVLAGSLTYTPPAAGTYYAVARNITSGCKSSTRTAVSVVMNPLPVPVISSSDPDNKFCAGTSIIFTAEGGTNYNFRVNGTSVQNGTSSTYTTSSITNNQVLDVIVTSSFGCVATSTGITNTVDALPSPTLSSSDADNRFCAGTSVIFTAGGGTSYNFRVNGTSVQNGASNTFTTSSLTNNQIVDVVVTNSSGCSAASSGITNTVYSLPSPTLTCSDTDFTFCTGTSVTFTAGGGTSYNFRVNGTNVQSGATNTYTTSSLTNNQSVDVVVTNSNGCVATSSVITVSVNALPSPVLTSSDADNRFCSGTSVTFTAGGGASYNFRVGGVSVQNGSSNTYTTTSLTNNQVVDVIVTNSNGCSATSSGITNTVYALPSPTLVSSDADNRFCAGTSVTFTAGGGTSYNFRVAGSSVQSGASATYTTSALANNQVVDVIVTNSNGCTAVSSGITNTVYSLPVPSLTSSDADRVICAGTSVTFTAGGGTSYNFRVAGTSVQSGSGNTYTTTTLLHNQVVDVIVTNADGCTATSAGITHTVNQVPTGNAGTGGNECDLDFVLKAVPSIGVGTWTKETGPGSATFTPNSNTATATVSVSEPGLYSFRWTEISNNCSNSSTITVNFYRKPVANAGKGGNNCGPSRTLAAVPDIGTGTWTKTSGPGNVSFSPNANSATATATVSAYGLYVLTWTEVNGTCSSSDTINVNYLQVPTPNAGSDGSQCDLDYDLNAVPGSGAGAGLWSLVSGPGTAAFTPSASVPGAKVTVSQYGTYNFAWTEINGPCFATDQITVIFRALPPLSAGRDTMICEGGSVQLRATGTGTFRWTPAALLNNANIANPLASPADPTNFTVTLTDQYGCVNTDVVFVDVWDQPAGDAGNDTTLNYVFRLKMDAVPLKLHETGNWELVSGRATIATPSDPKTQLTNLAVGENILLWKVTNGVCPVSNDYLVINVVDLVIPTLITPNGDTRNEYFVLRGLETLGTTELVIFDRRGSRVFVSDAYKNDWNGVDFNGKPLPEDTYYFTIKAQNGVSLSGYVVVRR